MNSPKVHAFFGFVSGICLCLLIAALAFGEPRDVYIGEVPQHFDQRLELQIALARPGGRLVNEGRIYRRCEDSQGRLVGPQPQDLNEAGNAHEGRFIDYRPDGTKTTWDALNGAIPSRWCWRS